jgi:predicted porin
MKNRGRARCSLCIAAIWAGGVAMPCAAESQIYGRLNVGVEATKIDNSESSDDVIRVSSYRSVVGFRGSEDLGKGLQTVWQVEGGLSIDSGQGSLTSRDTRVGLQGPFGMVFAGVWTLPYTSATSGFDPFYPTTAGYMAIMGNGSAPTSDNVIDTSAFDRRQRNVIQYWSPDMAGVSLRLAHSPNEEHLSSGAKPSLSSASVTYERHGLTLVLAHELHHEYQGVKTDDIATKVGIAWEWGPLTVAAVVEKLKYETAGGDLERNAWFFSSAYRTPLGTVKAAYSHAGDGYGPSPLSIGAIRSGDSTGASHLTIGFDRELSKRTVLLMFYSRMTNDARATYDFGINQLGTSQGGRPSVLSLGMKHNF